MHQRQRRRREDAPGLAVARDGQAVTDVGGRLAPFERPDVPPQRDALVQLDQRRDA